MATLQHVFGALHMMQASTMDNRMVRFTLQ